MTAKKRIYITGGTSGIGLGLARHYAGTGNDLVLLARDQSKLDAAVSACRDLAVNAGQVIAAVSLDITTYDTLATRMDSVVCDYGLPDLLILSAGIAGNKTFLNTSAAEFDRMVDINLAGSREVARGIDRHKAVIVPGFRAGLMVWTSRHFPGLFAWSSGRLLRWKFG